MLTRLGYYSRNFSTYQQKEISGYLKEMWNVEPLKGKWAMLARAYTQIRDVIGKSNAPLYTFLLINAPLIEIIEPDEYMATLGWTLTLNAEGQRVLVQEEKNLEDSLFTTTLSVNDLITHSYQQGYFTGDLTNVLVPEGEASLTMSADMRRSKEAQHTKGDDGSKSSKTCAKMTQY